MTWDYFCGEWLVWILIGFIFGPWITRKTTDLFGWLFSFIYFKCEKNTADKSLRIEISTKKILDKMKEPS